MRSTPSSALMPSPQDRVHDSGLVYPVEDDRAAARRSTRPANPEPTGGPDTLANLFFQASGSTGHQLAASLIEQQHRALPVSQGNMPNTRSKSTTNRSSTSRRWRACSGRPPRCPGAVHSRLWFLSSSHQRRGQRRRTLPLAVFCSMSSVRRIALTAEISSLGDNIFTKQRRRRRRASSLAAARSREVSQMVDQGQ